MVAGPDLAAASSAVATLLGARPVAGGRHPGRGTHNELVGLGSGSYLEVIGPDPEQPRPTGPRPFGIDDRTTHGLVGIAMRAPGELFDALVADLDAAGIAVGVQEMSRTTPDGHRLEWRVAKPTDDPLPGLFPFAIDWGSTRHPSADLDDAAAVARLRIEHPDLDAATRVCEALGISCEIASAPEPRLIAWLSVGGREVELR